jgi:competence protein ComEC
LPWQVLAVFFLAGVVCLRWPGAGMGAALVFWALQSRCRQFSQPGGLLLAMLLLGLGAAWHGLRIDDAGVPGWVVDGKTVQVRAVVEEVRPRPEKRLQLILKDVVCTRTDPRREEKLGGKTVLTWQEPLNWPAKGQRLTGELRIKPVRGFVNTGTWDSRFTWLTQGVMYRSFVKAGKGSLSFTGDHGSLFKLRQRLRQEVLSRTVPGSGRGLLLALLMGDRSELAYSDLDMVRRASLAHVLAQSGLHLGFVVGMAWLMVLGAGRILPRMYLRLPRRKVIVLLAGPLVLAYLWLGDFRPSLTRAALMFFFWGLLLFRGRSQVLTDGLFFSLAVIIALNPLAVFDLGLQMSILAVAGIILIWPVLSDLLSRLAPPHGWRRVLRPAVGLLGVSLVANLVLLPLMVWSFGQVSPHLYLNLIWLPVIGFLALPAGLLALICSLIPGLGPVSSLLFQLASVSLSLLMQGLEILDAHGALGVLLPLRPRWPELMGFWVLLLVLAVWWKRPGRLPLWCPALGLALLLWPGLAREWSFDPEKVMVKAVDVGQGQAVLIEWGLGRRMLVDGGGSWNRDFDLGRFAVAPALTWNRAPRVETVVLSHGDFDHLRGLFTILETFSVKRFVYNGRWPSGWDGRRLDRSLGTPPIPTLTVKAGDVIPLQPGLQMEVLNPDPQSELRSSNNRSLILRLAHKGQGLALLPGDAENEVLQDLVQLGAELESNLLVVPHHGSRSSLLPAFYRKVNPSLAVVSCGFMNIYRFPHPSVVQAIEDQGVDLLTTAEQGMIEVGWDLNRDLMTFRTAMQGIE